MAIDFKMSQKQIQLIAVAALIVIGGGYVYWNYFLKPEFNSIRDNTVKLNDLKQKIESAEREARRLPALKDERERLTTELSRLEKQLPKDKDVPNIIRALTREALQESLDFRQFAPKATVQKQYFAVVPFDIQMSGSLSALARFFTSLGQNERIFKFQNVKLTPRSGDESGMTFLNISFSVETYAYTGGS